ncbi:MAG: phenylphosphate carboxylase subunit delta [Burkholderiaceae bacterium]|nr:MAG: phenylphosphate carboxylase subunit delta [Burkholderiaceae bacterium]
MTTPIEAALKEAQQRARDVRVMIFDVDGVLTDGRLYYGPEGEALKVFHVLDGHGMKLLNSAGIRTAIITGRSSPILDKRAHDLGVAWMRQGQETKGAALIDLCKDLQVSPDECGYMGDDIIDLPVLTRVRFAAAVPAASAFVKQHVHWVAQASGGMGAVREVCNFILAAQGKLDAIQQAFLE